MVIFRENTEDIYAGIEFEEGSADAEKLMAFLTDEFPKRFEKIRFPDTVGHRHQAGLARGHRAPGPRGHRVRHRARAARASRSCTRATS